MKQLFRGKMTSTQKWEYGALVRTRGIDNKVHTAIIPEWNEEEEHIMNCMTAVIPETVGQYIWLKDKNGNKVFSGDIIKDRDGKQYVVCQVPGGFSLQRTSSYKGSVLRTYTALSDPQTASWFPKNAEVIGNVFENKELINGG